MSEWAIPGDADELFANGGDHSYEIRDRDYPCDNVESMRLFLDAVGITADMVEIDGGTQVVITDGTKRLRIDSGGLGDFHLHGFDVTDITND